jgi:hypothetical protein
MKLIKNLVLILISTAFSLIIVEIVLRIFTNYPRFPDTTNMVQDSNFGFKMNNDLKDIDELGFRNVDGKYKMLTESIISTKLLQLEILTHMVLV